MEIKIKFNEKEETISLDNTDIKTIKQQLKNIFELYDIDTSYDEELHVYYESMTHNVKVSIMTIMKSRLWYRIGLSIEKFKYLGIDMDIIDRENNIVINLYNLYGMINIMGTSIEIANCLISEYEGTSWLEIVINQTG